MHNAAQRVFEDLLIFTWPLGVIILRTLFFDSRYDRFKRLELIAGCVGLFLLFCLVADDGQLILALAKTHPVWGGTLLSAAISAFLSVSLRWRQTQSDNDELSRGVLDAQVRDIKLAGLRPAVFAGTTAALAALAIGWLYLISKSAAG